jgi:hypothetical protein
MRRNRNDSAFPYADVLQRIAAHQDQVGALARFHVQLDLTVQADLRSCMTDPAVRPGRQHAECERQQGWRQYPHCVDRGHSIQ